MKMNRCSWASRITAFFLLGVFLYATISAPFAEASLWAERRAALQPLVPTSAQPTTTKLSSALGVPDSIASAVAPYGEIVSAYLPASPRHSSFIIHVQDAHNIFGAQKNIAFIMNGLLQRGAGFVGVEGAAGKLSLLEEWRRTYDKSRLMPWAGYLLRDGFLSGVEVAVLNQPTGQARVLGLEEPSTYLAQIDVFKKTLAKNTDVQTWTRELSLKIEALKRKTYSASFLAWDHSRSAYAADASALGEYLSQCWALLSLGSRQKFPVTAQYLRLWKMEQGLNFAEVEAQESQIQKQLMPRLSAGELKALTQQSLLCRSGKISEARFLRELRAQAQKSGVAWSAVLASYCAYVEGAEHLNRENLSHEISGLEEKVAELLTGASAELYCADQDFRLAQKALDFTLTPGESERLALRHDEILHLPSRIAGSSPMPAAVVQNLQRVSEFNLLSQQRSEIFVRKLLAETAQEKTPSVLIAGGYHSAQIEVLLRKAGVSFITVRPNMTAQDLALAPHPLEPFRRQPLPIENIFFPEKAMLSQPLASGNFSSLEQNAAKGVLLLSGQEFKKAGDNFDWAKTPKIVAVRCSGDLAQRQKFAADPKSNLPPQIVGSIHGEPLNTSKEFGDIFSPQSLSTVALFAAPRRDWNLYPLTIPEEYWIHFRQYFQEYPDAEMSPVIQQTILNRAWRSELNYFVVPLFAALSFIWILKLYMAHFDLSSFFGVSVTLAAAVAAIFGYLHVDTPQGMREIAGVFGGSLGASSKLGGHRWRWFANAAGLYFIAVFGVYLFFMLPAFLMTAFPLPFEVKIAAAVWSVCVIWPTKEAVHWLHVQYMQKVFLQSSAYQGGIFYALTGWRFLRRVINLPIFVGRARRNFIVVPRFLPLLRQRSHFAPARVFRVPQLRPQAVFRAPLQAPALSFDRRNGVQFKPNVPQVFIRPISSIVLRWMSQASTPPRQFLDVESALFTVIAGGAIVDEAAAQQISNQLLRRWKKQMLSSGRSLAGLSNAEYLESLRLTVLNSPWASLYGTQIGLSLDCAFNERPYKYGHTIRYWLNNESKVLRLSDGSLLGQVRVIEGQPRLTLSTDELVIYYHELSLKYPVVFFMNGFHIFDTVGLLALSTQFEHETSFEFAIQSRTNIRVRSPQHLFFTSQPDPSKILQRDLGSPERERILRLYLLANERERAQLRKNFLVYAARHLGKEQHQNLEMLGAFTAALKPEDSAAWAQAQKLLSAVAQAPVEGMFFPEPGPRLFLRDRSGDFYEQAVSGSQAQLRFDLGLANEELGVNEGATLSVLRGRALGQALLPLNQRPVQSAAEWAANIDAKEALFFNFQGLTGGFIDRAALAEHVLDAQAQLEAARAFNPEVPAAIALDPDLPAHLRHFILQALPRVLVMAETRPAAVLRRLHTKKLRYLALQPEVLKYLQDDPRADYSWLTLLWMQPGGFIELHRPTQDAIDFMRQNRHIVIFS